jgi:hypothetical protein
MNGITAVDAASLRVTVYGTQAREKTLHEVELTAFFASGEEFCVIW